MEFGNPIISSDPLATLNEKTRSNNIFRRDNATQNDIYSYRYISQPIREEYEHLVN